MAVSSWIGPAIIAAIVASAMNYVLNIRLEQRRRREKIRDFQIALRAEIRSELHALNWFDASQVLDDVSARYDTEKDYSVVVPRLARNLVFEALVKEIHILPERVIDPVILYFRQRQVVEQFVEDMREPSFADLAKDRQLEMYRSYLDLRTVWKAMAENAEGAINAHYDE